MVTVVVVQSDRCFIGLSGSNSRVGQALEDALSLARSEPALQRVIAHAQEQASVATQLTSAHQPIFDRKVRQHRTEFSDDGVAVVISALPDTSLAD